MSTSGWSSAISSRRSAAPEGLRSPCSHLAAVALVTYRVGLRTSAARSGFLRDGIYELRVGLQHVNYRMLYFFHGRTAAVLSHGLAKEAAVPAKEIEKAIERKGKFVKNPKVHTHEEA